MRLTAKNGGSSEAETKIVTTLEIAFAEKALRHLCENETKAQRVLGLDTAKKLRRRLADLRAATSISDLVAGRPRELGGPCPRPIAVDLGEGARMVFSAAHNVNPLLESGCVDWPKVSRIKILRIETNYDES
jgi:toxin HigB-1